MYTSLQSLLSSLQAAHQLQAYLLSMTKTLHERRSLPTAKEIVPARGNVPLNIGPWASRTEPMLLH